MLSSHMYLECTMSELSAKNKKIQSLKLLMLLYIVLCLIFASLNYALVLHVSQQMGNIITSVWHVYENGFKILIIIIASLLTISVLETQKYCSMRKRNFIRFYHKCSHHTPFPPIPP